MTQCCPFDQGVALPRGDHRHCRHHHCKDITEQVCSQASASVADSSNVLGHRSVVAGVALAAAAVPSGRLALSLESVTLLVVPHQRKFETFFFYILYGDF